MATHVTPPDLRLAESSDNELSDEISMRLACGTEAIELLKEMHAYWKQTPAGPEAYTLKKSIRAYLEWWGLDVV